LHFPLIIAAYIEGAEGVKWVLGFAYFGLGKWDFMHWKPGSGIHQP
jgi:hypothetical protein